MKCRHCNSDLLHKLIDLGVTAPSNSYLTSDMLNLPEKKYPLKVLVCDKCWLVQTEDFVGVDEMFSPDYAYFSSFSSTWLDHAKKYVDMMITKPSNQLPFNFLIGGRNYTMDLGKAKYFSPKYLTI